MKINGKMIRKFRLEKGFTTTQVAAAAGLGQRSIEKYEAQESCNCNLNIAKAIAKFLGVKLEDISA